MNLEVLCWLQILLNKSKRKQQGTIWRFLHQDEKKCVWNKSWMQRIQWRTRLGIIESASGYWCFFIYLCTDSPEAKKDQWSPCGINWRVPSCNIPSQTASGNWSSWYLDTGNAGASCYHMECCHNSYNFNDNLKPAWRLRVLRVLRKKSHTCCRKQREQAVFIYLSCCFINSAFCREWCCHPDHNPHYPYFL